MYSHDELKSLHGFLKSTGEGNLKKMLCGGRMTDAHLRILLKVARAVKEDEFITHYEASTFPKVKMSPEEIGLKEAFWGIAMEACAKVGLVTAAKKAA
jgi:hypothetical protein